MNIKSVLTSEVLVQSWESVCHIKMLHQTEKTQRSSYKDGKHLCFQLNTSRQRYSSYIRSIFFIVVLMFWCLLMNNWREDFGMLSGTCWCLLKKWTLIQSAQHIFLNQRLCLISADSEEHQSISSCTFHCCCVTKPKHLIH